MCITLAASGAVISFDPTVKRYLVNGEGEEVSSFDRGKYINIHASTYTDTDVLNFLSEYGVGYGRNFWGPADVAYQKTGEYGVWPSYSTNPNTTIHTVNKGFICTQHPNDKGVMYEWDDDKIKLSGEYAAEYFNNTVSTVPEYFEPFNEPFVHSYDGTFSGTNSTNSQEMRVKISEYFKQSAIAIHNCAPLANMKVIGYAAAYPAFEVTAGSDAVGGLFGQWRTAMKLFMDHAGDHMDGYSVHLYDGINVEGTSTLRSGSNAEAILDLVESYEYHRNGKVTPFAISEYGGIDAETSGSAYTEPGSNRCIGSINKLIFSLIEREDIMLTSIPFIGEKSQWYITAANNFGCYGSILWKPTTTPTQEDVDNNFANVVWEYTPKIKFYELWKGVSGERFDITSTNPDIQTLALRNGSEVYIALNNLDDAEQTIYFSNIAEGATFSSVEVRSLESSFASGIIYNVTNYSDLPTSLTLKAEETVIIKASLGGDSSTSNEIRSKRYYSGEDMKLISNNMSWSFSNVAVPQYGRAVARVSIGRRYNYDKAATCKINGVSVEVPTNWRGYDQTSRSDGYFFGMIEIPFDVSLLNENGTQSVDLTFNDVDGGYVTSVVLKVDSYTSRPAELMSTLLNGDFEMGRGNGWSPLAKGGVADIVADSDEANGGTYSAQISGEAAIAQKLVLTAGATYKLTAQVKGSGENPSVRVVAYSSELPNQAQTYSVSSSYNNVSYTFTAPSTQEVIIRFENNNSDTVINIDDITLTAEE
ncbi:MAG: carbohydrate binding domain-containing protein [Rikenellaceae bacterium]